MNVDFNTPEMQKVLERVEKLLRLASNNPNEAEASSAAAKAQDILAAFNLDMSAVEERTGDKGKREDRKMTGGLYKWQRSVWEEVAELNFCLYWSIKGLTKGSKYEHRVLGRTVNILSTRMMAEYLEQAIERIAREHYDNQPSAYFAKPGIAYREGMTDRICERLRERRWEQEREARAKTKEEAARATHPSYAGRNALTIVDVRKSEDEANREFDHDLKYGAGSYAKEQANAAEWHAIWDAKAKAAREAEEVFKRDHPVEWAAREAMKRAEAEKRAREWQKREERNARRRTGVGGCSVKGPRHEDYYTGRERGGDVSLDRQVGGSGTRRIK